MKESEQKAYEFLKNFYPEYKIEKSVSTPDFIVYDKNKVVAQIEVKCYDHRTLSARQLQLIELSAVPILFLIVRDKEIRLYTKEEVRIYQAGKNNYGIDICWDKERCTIHKTHEF